MLARKRHEAPLVAVAVDRYRQARHYPQKLLASRRRQSTASFVDEQDVADFEKQQEWRERRFAAKALDSRDRARRAFVGERDACKDRSVDDEACQYLWP